MKTFARNAFALGLRVLLCWAIVTLGGMGSARSANEEYIIYSNPQWPITIQKALPDANWYPFGEAASANFATLDTKGWKRLPDKVTWTVVWNSNADGSNSNRVIYVLVRGSGLNVYGEQIHTTQPQFGPVGLDITVSSMGELSLAFKNKDQLQIGINGLAGYLQSPQVYQSRFLFTWFP